MGFLCSMKEPFDTEKSNWVFLFNILELHEYTREIIKNFHEKNWFEIKEEIATSYLAS